MRAAARSANAPGGEEELMSAVFFTGHMIDRPGRATPRFPQSLETLVAQRVQAELKGLNVADAFASGACGGDILFLETALAQGARVHLTLPCSIESFKNDCVDLIPGADWGARFERILRSAASVEVLGEQYASDNAVASDCCNRIMIGLAERCASERGQRPTVLALWDGRPGDAVGGTHSTVRFCQEHGLSVRWMQDLVTGGGAGTEVLAPLLEGTSSAIRHPPLQSETPQHICAVVFADAVGFSKLREREVPAFVGQYLDYVMQALRAHGIVPLVKNTWGDGLYMVFDSVRDAGRFALDFRDRIVSTDWRRLGLANAPNVRIGAHAGPLYRIYDPVLGQWSYVGSHVTRAARLEPSTDPGKVFASLAFVALAATENVTEFFCVPVGRRQLVKGAGEMSVFELLGSGAQDERAPYVALGERPLA
jgi:class 3 adenylate cyclase